MSSNVLEKGFFMRGCSFDPLPLQCVDNYEYEVDLSRAEGAQGQAVANPNKPVLVKFKKMCGCKDKPMCNHGPTAYQYPTVFIKLSVFIYYYIMM